MQPTVDRLSGGQLLVRQLLHEGATLGFCVPGESYLPVIDALHDVQDRFELLTCRHEATAAHMAEAAGRLTGHPGLCFVTRGPGALQASVGVHTAAQTSTPMLLLIGQVPRALRDREVFQEVDYRATFGSIAKWVVEITDVQRVPELVSRAYRTARSGRPGPVVVSLPEDVLWDTGSAAVWRSASPSRARACSADQARLTDLLGAASNPIMLLGGPDWTMAAKKALECLSHDVGLAVATTFRRQDYFDNRHPHYAGPLGLPWHAALALRVAQSDLVLAVGTRLGSVTTDGYTLLSPQDAEEKLVHVHDNPGQTGSGLPVREAITASAVHFVEDLAGLLPGRPPSSWREWSRQAHADHRAWTSRGASAGPVDLAAVMRTLRALLPDDTVFTNGAGNYTAWIHRYLEYRQLHTQVAPINGAMGYGLPAAVAAALTHPERRVVAFAGDGCFQMASPELATARARGLPLVVVVINNNMLGTIRMHQDRHYPGRGFATALDNPDFVALAHAHGVWAERVAATEEFEPALRRALMASGPTLLEIVMPPDAATLPG